jgi:hypothetical protein
LLRQPELSQAPGHPRSRVSRPSSGLEAKACGPGFRTLLDGEFQRKARKRNARFSRVRNKDRTGHQVAQKRARSSREAGQARFVGLSRVGELLRSPLTAETEGSSQKPSPPKGPAGSWTWPQRTLSSGGAQGPLRPLGSEAPETQPLSVAWQPRLCKPGIQTWRDGHSQRPPPQPGSGSDLPQRVSKGRPQAMAEGGNRHWMPPTQLGSNPEAP